MGNAGSASGNLDRWSNFQMKCGGLFKYVVGIFLPVHPYFPIKEYLLVSILSHIQYDPIHASFLLGWFLKPGVGWVNYTSANLR